MPLPSPFHARTAELCTSYRWKEWAGFHAVCSFDTCHEREYVALRHAAGLLDVTPLYKYRVAGPDAARFLARVTSRDVTRLKVGQVGYGCWCDEGGKVLDDGTVARLDETSFRVTSADPSYGWLVENALGWDVTIEDVSRELAALALQGPNARAVLDEASDGAAQGLGFFRLGRASIGGVALEVTRTGYTGDLGYELWMPADGALRVWDALLAAGRPHGLEPMGLDALDVARIEAGFILLGVDYRSARRCLIDVQKSSPFEIGLGWTVHLDRDPFVGQAALRREAEAGSAWGLAGLELDYEELEDLYERYDLPVQLPAGASRLPVPVYDGPQQIGYATSSTWSPLLKRSIALASLRRPWAEVGRRVAVEVTIEYERRRVSAEVVRRPFFDPERKRA